MGLVEASRRYGVEKPGMSVASGSAAKQPTAPAVAEGDKTAPGGAGGGGAGGGGKESADLKAARDRLAAAKAERDKVKKDVDALNRDNNPDPLSASQRNSKIQEKNKQLADLDKQIAKLQAEVDKATQAAAEKPAEEKPAAEKPAEKKPPERKPAEGTGGK